MKFCFYCFCSNSSLFLSLPLSQELQITDLCARRECYNRPISGSKYCSKRCGILQARYIWKVFFFFFIFIIVVVVVVVVFLFYSFFFCFPYFCSSIFLSRFPKQHDKRRWIKLLLLLKHIKRNLGYCYIFCCGDVVVCCIFFIFCYFFLLQLNY